MDFCLKNSDHLKTIDKRKGERNQQVNKEKKEVKNKTLVCEIPGVFGSPRNFHQNRERTEQEWTAHEMLMLF